MNTKEWAALLHGREYGNEITWKEELQAKDDGIVIVSGASDDIMVFSGAISAERGAYNGATAYVTSSGLLDGCDKDPKVERCKYLVAAMKAAVEIKAIWSPKLMDGASWLIEAPEALPHEHFDIMEDGELFCRGIVFRLADVPKPASDADEIAKLRAERDNLLSALTEKANFMQAHCNLKAKCNLLLAALEEALAYIEALPVETECVPGAFHKLKGDVMGSVRVVGNIKHAIAEYKGS